MIILEGTPGAGKTTLITKMSSIAGPRVRVFPEAQPPTGGTDAQVVDALLAEDQRRITIAARLPAGMVAISDRCHIGVIAYRMALVATDRRPRAELDYVLERVEHLDLWRAHRGDRILILLLDPAESIRRRHAYRLHPRYRLWFELDYLRAYNSAMEQLASHEGENITIADSFEQAARLVDLAPIGESSDQAQADGNIASHPPRS